MLPPYFKSLAFARLGTVLWILIIFVSIPLARQIQTYVNQACGRAFFLLLVAIFLAAAVLALLRRLWRQGGRAASWLWLCIISAAYLVWLLQIRNNPEETVHFVEYGILSLFALRIFVLKGFACTAYFGAFLLCALTGTLDEIIQWFTPNRTFDYRDIALNAGAGLLPQLAVWKVMRPPFEKELVTISQINYIFYLVSCQAALLLICLSNTPKTINWYTNTFPALLYLQTKPSVMTDFGYYHRLPDAASFYSRFSLNDLATLDQNRKESAGGILKQYPKRAAYPAFLARYTPLTDPFLHEIRVHIFRRDEYLHKARFEANNEKSAWIALGEERILRQVFPQTLAASGLELSPQDMAFLEKQAPKHKPYRSPISSELITTLSLVQLWLLGAAIIVLLYLLRIRMAKLLQIGRPPASPAALRHPGKHAR